MKKSAIVFTILCLLFLISCGNSSSSKNESSNSETSSDSGKPLDKNVTVSLFLPFDDAICEDYDENDIDTDDSYCINPSDQIIISAYAKEALTDEYSFIEDYSLVTDKAGQDSVQLSFSMDKKHSYLRLFVKVMNKHGKLKLTGGADSITKNEPKIFLAPAGDFARVMSDRNKDEDGSLHSYFEDEGSKGSAAVALKDGSIFMTGGYNFGKGTISDKAFVFDMKSISQKEVKPLPVPLYDHITALLDDGSLTGKSVVGLGITENEALNSSLWVYEPEADKYLTLTLPGSPAMTKAKAITIDGDIYIVGGCSESKAETSVYKISAKTGKIVPEIFARLKTGRCNHAVADVSTVDKDGKKTVKILVIGGSTNYMPEGHETPVTGENFAELVTQSSSKSLPIADRNGLDDSNLKTKGLISPAAVGIVMDDKEKNETIVSVIGGYFAIGDNADVPTETNPYLFVFSQNGENALVYDKNYTPFECARPSAALLGSGDKSKLKYVAVNCGSKEADRTLRHATDQVVFVLQVKRVKDSDLGMEVFSSSVKDTLMDENRDRDSDAVISDGPVAVDGLGQVFMLGGKYVYQVGSYALPGTPSSQVSAKLPPKPIIHVAFEYPIVPPMSYRNIYDMVLMDLKETCVSDPDAPEKCLKNWQEKYYIKYKWEMTESPTPLLEDSKLKLADTEASAGQWLAYQEGKDDPRRAQFKGLMITPKRYSEPNDTYNASKCESECGDEPGYDKSDKYFFRKLSEYLLCRQKYCEKNRTQYYKINIQAETVDKETGFVSDTADITVIPKIIPQARVLVQLTWKQGYKSRAEMDSEEGVNTDLDLHFIKKTSLEAANDPSMTNKEGLLGTKQKIYDIPSTDEEYNRHDDCNFGDNGLISDNVDASGTIQWHASLDIDNSWGGGNYENPEVIGMGPIYDSDGDGKPDVDIFDDQYLVVVGYVNCSSHYEGDDDNEHCQASYSGEDGAYEVDARVTILIDGKDAPRKAGSDRPADSYTSDFKIKLNEWKAIAVIKWDNGWKSSDSNPAWKGNAIVTDQAMTEEGITTDPVSHPVCTYDASDAILIPIWDADTYRNYIMTPDPETGWAIGNCK